MTDAEIKVAPKSWIPEELKKTIALRDKISQKGKIFKILDLVPNLIRLLPPIKIERVERFNEEIEKFSNDQEFDYLFMFDFIAELIENKELNDKNIETVRAAKRKKSNYPSQLSTFKTKKEILTKLEPYFLMVDALWDKPTGKNNRRTLKKNAIKDIWKKHESEIKAITHSGEYDMKKMSMELFSSKFEDYLDLCRELNDGKRPNGQKLEKYEKSPNK